LLKQLEASSADLLPKPLHRYGLDPTPVTGEDYLHALAQQRNQGDVDVQHGS